LQPAGEILRCIGQASVTPSGACRDLRSAGYAAGRNRAAPTRAEKRGRRFLPAFRGRGPLAKSALAAGRREKNRQGPLKMSPLFQGRARGTESLPGASK